MTTFRDAAAPFLAGGFKRADLVPVVPFDAVVSDQSRIAPAALGKAPGRYHPTDKQWSGLPDWRDGAPKASADWPTPNVGLKADHFPGLDIDAKSAEVAALVWRLADLYLGVAPVRVRRNAPSMLMPYRTFAPFPKRRMAFFYGTPGTEPRDMHAVEVLCQGQQYLIAGIHTSGAPYEWDRNTGSLDTWGPDGLTAISATEVDEFFDALEQAIVASGGTLSSRSVAATYESGRTRVVDAEPIGTPDTIFSALASFRNDQETFPARNDLVGVAAAVKAALGRHSVAAGIYERFEAWATADGWAEPDYVSHIWHSIDAVQVNPTRLFDMARMLGEWHGDAALDFEPMTEAEERAMVAADTAVGMQTDTLGEIARKLVYWPDEGLWFAPAATGGRNGWSHQRLNFHPIGCRVSPAGAGGKKAAAAILANSGLVRSIVGVTYRPGQGDLVNQEWDGRTGLWLNRYRPGPPPPAPATTTEAGAGSSKSDTNKWNVEPFLAHLNWLFEEREAHVLLQWMAYTLQHPGKKIRFAPVLIGGQGLGKDSVMRPLVYAVGKHNYAEITPHQLSSQFTSWYEKQVVIVQEMERSEKLDVYERIKNVICGTGADELIVNEKFKAAYSVPNTLNMAFLTNHEDAFAISHDDRRLLVLKCIPDAPREPEYYADLHDWFDTGGLRQCHGYLMSLDLRGFSPTKAPIWTAAKTEMLIASLPAPAEWLRREVSPGGEFSNRLVLAYRDVSDRISADFGLPKTVRERWSQKQFSLGLRAAGWGPHPHPLMDEHGNRFRAWVRGGKRPELVSPHGLRNQYDKERAAQSDFSAA